MFVVEKPSWIATLSVRVGAGMSKLQLGSDLMIGMTTEEKVPVQVAFTTKHGKPATVDGKPIWASTDESVATVTGVSEDGLTAFVESAGPGVCQVTCKADADLGEGVREITLTAGVEVRDAEAEGGEIMGGEPVEK